MSPASRHRLEGLEPDNLLAFLALLGLLRALELSRPEWHPRAYWDVARGPLRPVLTTRQVTTPAQVAESAATGLEIAAQSHDFDGRKDLNYSPEESRNLLAKAAETASLTRRYRADLVAALMSDAATKDEKNVAVTPTPLCLLFGQGHQHFLDRLASVPRQVAPPPRGKGKHAVNLSASECLAEALFQPWHRNDPTFSFRWDSAEDVRYALMAGDPTDSAFKAGTQHGANRLAALGLAEIILVPEIRAGRVRPSVVGGVSTPKGFSIAWPIWQEAATLSAVRALLSHPDLRKEGALLHFGFDHVMVAERISVGKFMNFTRGRPLSAWHEAVQS
ncbi:MAG: hypothetical protein EA405_10780 [Rhodospirillales bacterium]|nr:MAG: hypothetical protein EA405_10780 [Rhodospirillales bacterium]